MTEDRDKWRKYPWCGQPVGSRTAKEQKRVTDFMTDVAMASSTLGVLNDNASYMFTHSSIGLAADLTSAI